MFAKGSYIREQAGVIPEDSLVLNLKESLFGQRENRVPITLMHKCPERQSRGSGHSGGKWNPGLRKERGKRSPRKVERTLQAEWEGYSGRNLGSLWGKSRVGWPECRTWVILKGGTGCPTLATELAAYFQLNPWLFEK